VCTAGFLAAPLDGERVVFVAHFERGFALPASDFFQDVLDYYGLQPHHLPANVVMILSAFAAFCEGFASIEAFVHAWAKYFQLRKQSAQEPKDKNAPDAGKEKEKDKNRPMTLCGAGTIMLARLRVSQDLRARICEEVAGIFLLREEPD
jgi:hypothetical protein